MAAHAGGAPRVPFPSRGPEMPVIKVNGQQFALQPGQNRMGGGTPEDVFIGHEGAL
jgi:hypothetical protein